MTPDIFAPIIHDLPSARRVLSVYLSFNPNENSDYVQHLISLDKFEAAIKALRITGKLSESANDDYYAMLVLTQIDQWSIPSPSGRQVWAYRWGRDCDQFEASSVYLIDATLANVLDHRESVYDDAEGPVSFCLVPPEYAADFHPVRRDHAAEAAGY